jgi:protein ImuB
MFACLYSPSASQASLLALASSFSPLVEDTAPGVVVFSIVGLSKLIGTVDHIASEIARIGAAAKIHGNLAIAADPDAAMIAARHIGGLTMIPPGREEDRLSGLPIHVLGHFIADPDLKILDTLDRWGIKTLGEIAALPPLGFIARFGELGERLLRLARGETQRALRVRQAPETYERRVDLEHPQALLEPLLFVISSMLQELLAALECQGLATNRVTLGLKLVKGGSHQRTLEFPVPVRDVQVILKQLQFDLEAHPPTAAILGVEVKLNPVEPRAMQHGLFIPQAPAPEKLSLTLARLKALVGEGNAGSPELLDTHRPDAFQMRTFAPAPASELARTAPLPGALRFAFRCTRPALSAQVKLKLERPLTVKFPTQVNTREVLAAAGPWRSSGDWWTPAPWDREEWDIELSDGGLYRVFRASKEWFLEGVYD